MPPPDPEVYAYMKGQGMPDRDAEGMAAIGWFSDVPSPLTDESTLDEIHDYAAMSEAGSDFIFNLPNVVAYADGLLDEVAEEETTIEGVDGNDIPLIVNTPRASSSSRAVLFIHGGGMALLSATSAAYRAWARLLARDGLTVVSVDFRNSSGVGARAPFPAGLDDCVAALRWLGEREDIDEITVHGESGGANLTIATCVRAAKLGVATNKVSGAVPWAPYIAGPVHWGDWRNAEFQSLRDNNGAGFPVAELIHFARTYTPDESDWTTGEAWPIFLTDDEIDLLPTISLHTNDLDTLRDEGIAFSRRLARAGKLAGHMNHLGTTHAMHVYTPIFDATEVTELSAKLVTAFALRNA
ncbi:MAG: alpha/beta hydrolase fold domain-containing protein [Actinomycetota bacterium]